MKKTVKNDTIAAGVSDDLDAARLRALAECPRICMHGSAGVNPETGGRTYPDQAGQVHFGAQLMPARADEQHTAWGRSAIVAIAEDRMHVEGGWVSKTPVGVSVPEDAERFRALMRLPRIRVMSSWNDGDVPLKPTADPQRPGLFGFRAEFWSKAEGEVSEQCDPWLGRRCILVLADDLIALEKARSAGTITESAVDAAAETPAATVDEKVEPHGMEQIVSVIEGITKRIEGASNSDVETIRHRLATVDAYVKTCNWTATVPLAALRAVKEARGAAMNALRERSDRIIAEARRLIQALPKDRRSRSTLCPATSESEVMFAISFGSNNVNKVIDEGQACEVLLDGGLVDAIEHGAIDMEKDELVIQGIGRWPMDDLIATSSDDGFAFLLANGQLVEIQEAA